jgi:hypothetical protein
MQQVLECFFLFFFFFFFFTAAAPDAVAICILYLHLCWRREGKTKRGRKKETENTPTHEATTKKLQNRKG